MPGCHGAHARSPLCVPRQSSRGPRALSTHTFVATTPRCVVAIRHIALMSGKSQRMSAETMQVKVHWRVVCRCRARRPAHRGLAVSKPRQEEAMAKLVGVVEATAVRPFKVEVPEAELVDL